MIFNSYLSEVMRDQDSEAFVLIKLSQTIKHACDMIIPFILVKSKISKSSNLENKSDQDSS